MRLGCSNGALSADVPVVVSCKWCPASGVPQVVSRKWRPAGGARFPGKPCWVWWETLLVPGFTSGVKHGRLGDQLQPLRDKF